MVSIKDRVLIPLSFEGGEVKAFFITFNGLSDQREHFAIEFPSKGEGESSTVRIHSECITGDVFHSMRCDCGKQLHEAIAMMSAQGGYILYLRQEGRDIGFVSKMASYALQDQGMTTYEANKKLGYPEDGRCYQVAAEMIHALNLKEISLLSNNPEKERQLRHYNVMVKDRLSTSVFKTKYNENYLKAKQEDGGHHLSI